ncbi:uncharacterized protein LOC116921268 isoform X2 [Daphnia magna]|uniref:uncharacterized protein LOC116921268 isoform X2 n=1 Tax=Daphnia magna TaxID=35525 RepID=UPI001E1BB55D|nr:uncharacterized protein LOC116921268 isoform X2 [Daphnia magna]
MLMIMTMNIARGSCFHRLARWGIGKRQVIGLDSRAFHGMNGSMIEISDVVTQAIKNNEPVVALESTIITHGMPYPANLETALKVENVIKAKGAVPATIGIIKGRVHVGLTADQLELLATMREPCLKTSRRDLPYVLSKKINGGTTVSGTMLVAAKVGIPIFVTGGIGGVHRGAEESFDISADLTELGRTPVAVVSSGVKSILDIGKTLEYLETQGVCVATLGSNNDFPAFFTPSSGFQAPYRLETTTDAARMIHQSLAFDTGSGMLIAVPIPESSQADGETIERAIRAALTLADQQNIRGRDVTPFVLSQVNRLTSGASLTANRALIEHNAAIGAAIAVDLARLRQSTISTGNSCSTPPLQKSGDHCPTVVIGGSIVDLVAAVQEDSIQDSRGIFRLASASTASYTVILDNKGDCQFGIGDLKIHSQLTVDKVRQYEEDIAKCRLLIMDGNIELTTMEYILDLCRSTRVPVWYEPTDTKKAAKPFTIVGCRSAIAYTSPNLSELKKIVETIQPGLSCKNDLNLNQTIEEIQDPLTKLCIPLLDTAQCIMVTLGKLGMMIVRRGAKADRLPVAPWQHQPNDEITATYYSAPTVDHIVSVSGAGDCLAAGFITGIINGWEQDKCAAFGLQAAACSLRHSPAVPAALSNLQLC